RGRVGFRGLTKPPGQTGQPAEHERSLCCEASRQVLSTSDAVKSASGSSLQRTRGGSALTHRPADTTAVAPSRPGSNAPAPAGVRPGVLGPAGVETLTGPAPASGPTKGERSKPASGVTAAGAACPDVSLTASENSEVS